MVFFIQGSISSISSYNLSILRSFLWMDHSAPCSRIKIALVNILGASVLHSFTTSFIFYHFLNFLFPFLRCTFSRLINNISDNFILLLDKSCFGLCLLYHCLPISVFSFVYILFVLDTPQPQLYSRFLLSNLQHLIGTLTHCETWNMAATLPPKKYSKISKNRMETNLWIHSTNFLPYIILIPIDTTHRLEPGTRKDFCGSQTKSQHYCLFTTQFTGTLTEEDK